MVKLRSVWIYSEKRWRKIGWMFVPRSLVPDMYPRIRKLYTINQETTFKKFGSKTILYVFRPQTPGKVSDEFT